MHFATIVANRFAVVTTLARSVAALEMLAQRYGVADRCRVRAADVPVLALEDPQSDASTKIRREIGRALEEDAAECILLGCAGMADLARTLSDEFSIPVIDGVAAATRLVEAAVSIGLKTSKSGAYAQPLPKQYTGAFARFAP